MNRETLDNVPVYALISIQKNTGKETQKDYWNDLKQVLEYRVYIGRQIPKILETKKEALKSCVFPGLLYGAQTQSLAEKGRDAPNLPAEDGTKNTANCMERQTD